MRRYPSVCFGEAFAHTDDFARALAITDYDPNFPTTALCDSASAPNGNPPARGHRVDPRH